MSIRIGWEMLLSAVTTAVGFTANMLGVKTTATPANARAIGAGDVFRGAGIQFFGVGADNTTALYKVFRRVPVLGAFGAGDLDARSAGSFQRTLVCSGTFSLSASLACPTGSNIPFPAGAFFADTITCTIDPHFQTLIDTLAGGATVVEAFSPGDNSDVAELSIADIFDGSQLEVELIVGTCTSVNAMVFLTR